jgi:hypothetical protein
VEWLLALENEGFGWRGMKRDINGNISLGRYDLLDLLFGWLRREKKGWWSGRPYMFVD